MIIMIIIQFDARARHSDTRAGHEGKNQRPHWGSRTQSGEHDDEHDEDDDDGDDDLALNHVDVLLK